MNYKGYYIPVISEVELQDRKPVRLWLGDLPVVLFRSGRGVYAFEDFCPHRGAPLSGGNVINNRIICPYHGWQFSFDGQNQFVPVKQDKTDCSLKPVYVRRSYGIVWLSQEEHAVIPEISGEVPAFSLQGSIHATLLNTLENFLEGSHTHFIHDGWVRSSRKRREPIDATMVPGDNGFTVHYSEEPPKGFITFFIPSAFRDLKASATFIFPSVAILEYKNLNNDPVVRIEALLTGQKDEVRYIARIFLKKEFSNPLVKFFVRRIFKKIIAQDQYILELQAKNLSSFPQNKFHSDDSDVVGAEINNYFNNRERVLKSSKSFVVWW